MIKISRDLLLSLVAVVAFCCLVELGFRVTGTRFEASFFGTDPTLGYVTRPNSHGWNVWENQEYIRMNSFGMRDREHAISADPNVIRIAVLGDSHTEGKEVAMNDDFCSVLERELNARLAARNQRVEVMNFAVGGYALAQEYLLIKNRVLQFNPQIVILSNLTSMAIRRSTRKLYVGPIQEGTPFFVLRNGELVLDDETLRQQAAYRNESRLHQAIVNWTNEYQLLGLIHLGLIEAHKKIAEIKAGFSKRTVAKDPDEAFASLGSFWTLLRVEHAVTQSGGLVENDPDLAEAWKVSEAILLKIRDEVASHNAQLWIFTLAMSFEVDPDRAAREAFVRRFDLPKLFASDLRLAEFARSEGIPIEVLGPDLASYAERHKMVLHGFPGGERNSGHYNQSGHSAVGHLMADKLWQGSPLFNSAKSVIASAHSSQASTP